MENGRVTVELLYSADNGRPLDYFFFEPDASIERNPPGTDPRRVEMHPAWPVSDQLNVDREGFELLPFVSSFRSFDDTKAVKQHFYPEAAELVQRRTGAKRVVAFDCRVRTRATTDSNARPRQRRSMKELARPAIHQVHSDFTARSAQHRLRSLMRDEAEALLSRRVAFYNVWKPLFHPVEELPMAFCDAQSTREGDMLVMELKFPRLTGEIYVMRYAPEHRWLYFPGMTPDQAILSKAYDSLEDGRARFVGHTAIEDPATPPNARMRESVEVRTMAFF